MRAIWRKTGRFPPLTLLTLEPPNKRATVNLPDRNLVVTNRHSEPGVWRKLRATNASCVAAQPDDIADLGYGIPQSLCRLIWWVLTLVQTGPNGFDTKDERVKLFAWLLCQIRSDLSRCYPRCVFLL